MPQIALDKKSNFEYLEKEVGLHKFLPKNVINTTKPKLLRKLIQQHFKKYAVLQDLECMFKFFEILKSVYRFDQERYRCALGVRTGIVKSGPFYLHISFPPSRAGPYRWSLSSGRSRGSATWRTAPCRWEQLQQAHDTARYILKRILNVWDQ